ncbi:MAG: DegT/DnrJ/EryC1/StrS family aminotransferase [bacterium]|nr:DegT/DnrJ/EryC1/StrS family aminotransferase [bacterium]
MKRLLKINTMMNVPVNEPVITDAAKKYVTEAVESGWVSSGGKYIPAFEEKFAEFIGVKHAITTTNGNSALHLALVALDVGPDDEVILPAFTMGACLNAVLYTGATPVLVDSEPETFNIDTSLLEAHVSPKTKAIMPVHIYGHACEMDAVMEIAQKHNIAVLEDAAEVHGGTYKGQMCGSIGDIGCFSFYGNKIVTTGEGGMVVTDDDALASRMRSLKDIAHSPDRRFWHDEMGFNYRMTNMQAGLGLGQLENVDTFLAHKQWMGEEYTKRLRDISGLRLPITKDGVLNVYWMYTVLVEDDFGMNRDDLRAALKEKGIDTRDFFYSLADMGLADTARKDASYPVAEDIAQRGFYLPSGLALSEEQLSYVCETLHAIAGS